MLTKVVLSIVLSLSVISCFADSGGNESKPLIDVQKKMQSQSSAQSNSQSQPAQSSASPSNAAQSAQENDTKEKPSMVEYCRKHPC